ncbi:MAG: hypothetical protein Q4C83_00480 [Candidatus Saccharibacteria bacterium]|nr:hypothetical protein [Candidatus Saccharibacteria bacterium]
MNDDNNPFRPALAKPADDSMLANDPAVDNFLAGNDNLQARPTLDGQVMQPAQPVRQMNDVIPPAKPAVDFADTKPASNTNDDLFGGLGLGDATAATDAATTTATAATTAPESKPKKKGGLLGGRKKKAAEPANPLFDDANAVKPTSFDPLDPAMPATEPTKSDSLSPIDASLAAAATAADSKTEGVEINNKPAKKAKNNGQPKQLTVSVLTIIFGILFLASAGAAVYFYMGKSDVETKLADTEASLQSLQDETNTSTNSSNKANTQFDSLQQKIQELTKTNQESQKKIEENNQTITNLNKEKTDLQTKLDAANNKLTSDTQVSENMKSLITTLCTDPTFQGSSACVSQAGAVTPVQAQ